MTSARSAPQAKLERALLAIDEMTGALGERPMGDNKPFDLRRLEWFDLRNMLLVARTVTMSALARGESRGAHQREDLPGMLPQWRAEPGGTAGPERRGAHAGARRHAGGGAMSRYRYAAPARDGAR